jgi:hypothetical protein
MIYTKRIGQIRRHASEGILFATVEADATS